MGYYGGQLVPGLCEDAPACGHQDTESGSFECPQPQPTAQEREEAAQQLALEAEENGPQGEDCQEVLAKSDEIPNTWSVERPFFTGTREEKADARADHERRSGNFQAEVDEHDLQTYTEMLALAKKHGVTLEVVCGLCRECFSEAEMEAEEHRQYLAEIY